MTTARRDAVVMLLLLSAGCGSSSPTSSMMQPAAPLSTTTVPPLSGPSRTFIFDRELSDPVSDGTTESRFVLYDNGAFVLRYTDVGIQYPGGYTQRDDAITFVWDGVWSADAILRDGSLTVRYNVNMQMDGFDDAVYIGTQ